MFYIANKLDLPISNLNSKLSKYPTMVRMTILSPLILFIILATIDETPFTLFYILIKTFSIKPDPVPTPRKIYLRTGLKVNGYNGYRE
jgi:hypothetical protein